MTTNEGEMLLTIFLKHHQTMNLAEINEKLEQTGFWKILIHKVTIATCTDKWKDACLEAVPGATAYICSEFWHERAKTSGFGTFIGSKKAVQKLKKEEAEYARS